MGYHKYLARARQAVRLQRVARGLLLSISLLAATAGLLLALSAWAEGDRPLQSILGLFFVLVALYGLGAGILVPLLRPISDRFLLERVEKLHPEIQQRLSTAHYLLKHLEEVRKYAFSPDLVHETIDWAETEVEEDDFRSLPDWSALVRPAVITLLLVLGWVALVLLSPAMVRRIATDYLAAAGYATSVVSSPEIEIPGRIEVARGEAAEITASISKPAESAWIHIRQEGQDWQSRKMEGVGTEGRLFRLVVPVVRTAARYYVSTGGHTSPIGTIQPVDPPRIEKFVYRISPPAYTHLPVRTTEQTSGDLEAPVGSRIELTLVANNVLSIATIHWSGAESRFLRLAGPREAAAAFELLEPSAFRISLRDQRGFEVKGLGPFHLVPEPDQPPQIFIHHPPAVSELGAFPAVTVDWEVVDDYGVIRLDLFYQLNYTGVESRVEVARAEGVPAEANRASAPTIFEPTPALRDRFQWDLSDLTLLPGDEVTFYLVAWDNDSVGGPKAATSEVHLLRLPTAADLYEEFQPHEVSQLDQLEKVLEHQREIREQAQQLRENIERRNEELLPPRQRQPSGEVQWDDQQKMQQLSQEQKELEEELSQLQSEIQQTLQQLTDPNSFSLKTLEKMARVQELLDELLTDDLRMVLDQFQKTLEEMSKDRPVEALQELDLSMEQFEENLDRMLSLLENSLLEQQLDAMIQQTESLQAEQEALQEQSEEAAREDESALSPEDQAAREEMQEELARQQQALEEKTQELLEQMQQLAQEQAGKNEELSQGLKETLKQSQEQQLQESQQAAVEELQAGQMSQASQSQQTAAEALSQMKQNLTAAAQSMGGMDFERDITELRRALDRALVLSERQEKVATELNPRGQVVNTWGRSSLKNEVTLLQRYYRDEALRTEEVMRELARKDPFLDFEAIRLLRLAARAMNRTVEGAENLSVFQVNNQVRLALSDINSAILVLLDSLNSLSQAQASSSLGNYFQNLEQLIRRQQQLNEMTRQQHRKRGQVPDWQQQLQRLADEQAAIRRKTEELFRKYGQLEQLLESLDQAGKEMRDVEKQLEDEITDERVQEKQEEVLTRLLDAEKSAREQGTTKERQSETAGAYTSESPPQLPETLQSVQNRAQKLRQGLGIEAVPLEYRDRVRHYFRSLSEESGWE